MPQTNEILKHGKIINHNSDSYIRSTAEKDEAIFHFTQISDTPYQCHKLKSGLLITFTKVINVFLFKIYFIANKPADILVAIAVDTNLDR